jgi:photosystem II stability/assembly factor-like uncharacterized protein
MRRPSKFLSATVTTALAAALLAGTGAGGTAAAAEPGEYRPVRGPSAPEEHRYRQKTLPGQGIPRNAYATAAAQAQRIPQTGGKWQSLGPTNIGGRIVSVALDPHRRDTVYAAAASGGLWRSTDAGRTFAPAWPDHWTQAMGAVAASPDGTLYVGTGEPNPGGGSITYEGTGLYASNDGGRNWRSIGLRDSGAISAITVDPRDPRRIFVAAAGSLYNGGGERGVYRSLDGGRSWTRVLAGSNEFTGATEVMIDPSDADRLYAVMWDHRRVPEQRSYGGVGSGVYRSTDGGRSWQRLDSLVPVGPEVGRIGLGLAPSDPKRLYAILSKGSGGSGTFDGFLSSSDGGDTWSRLPHNTDLAASQSSFPWWFGKVWVDPDDADHVHVAGVGLLTTKDAGRTWTSDTTSIHVDHHAMVWDPRYPSRVYLGNDGGMYRSDADGDGGWVKAEHQPYMQFYSAAITPQDTTRYSGGTQDNGSLRSWGSTEGFNEYLGGDGEENQINPRDKQNVFACYQYGNCFRSTDGGDTLTYFGNKIVSDRRNWFTPIEIDPADPNVLYTGGNRLNRSTDGGVTWAAISPDLTGGPGQDSYPFGTITTVAPARDGRTVYAGTDDGRIWVTRDTGATWSLIRAGGVWVTRIAVSATDPARIWVTLSGYRSGSASPYVLTSSDAGRSWSDLGGNLPQAPVNDVIQGAGRTLYVATDQGVFVSRDGGPRWLRLGRGLPMVPVDDIEYDGRNHRLVAATFGRGLYRTTVG